MTNTASHEKQSLSDSSGAHNNEFLSVEDSISFACVFIVFIGRKVLIRKLTLQVLPFLVEVLQKDIGILHYTNVTLVTK